MTADTSLEACPPKLVLSTRDLSQILRVNESSVKRWADLGVIQCFRTPGGHRKFTLQAVQRFVLEQKFSLDPNALKRLGLDTVLQSPVGQIPTLKIEARPAAYDPQTTVYDVELQLGDIHWTDEALRPLERIEGFILGVRTAFSLLGVRVPYPEIKKEPTT